MLMHLSGYITADFLQEAVQSTAQAIWAEWKQWKDDN